MAGDTKAMVLGNRIAAGGGATEPRKETDQQPHVAAVGQEAMGWKEMESGVHRSGGAKGATCAQW